MDLETTPVGDLDGGYNFVVSSWVHSWLRGAGKTVDKATFHATFPQVARRIADLGHVDVLHFPGNTDLFLGWVAFDRQHPDRVYYVYVRQSFRRSGYAKWLLKQHPGASYALQPVGGWKREMLARYGLRHDPHLLGLIGDDDAKQATAADK